MCSLDNNVLSPLWLMWPQDMEDKRAHSKSPEPPDTHTPCKGHPPTSVLPTGNNE